MRSPRTSAALPRLKLRHADALEEWLGRLHATAPASSNVPAMGLPFQRWFKFKEAFSPALIIDSLRRADGPVHTCLDPFGGCGTTGLTAQFLGIRPTLIEVNPFIADLAEAKLASYDRLALLDDFYDLVRAARGLAPASDCWASLPSTFCQPGIDGRYLYRRDTLSRILAYREAIERLARPAHARLFRVLLGSILVPCSNAVVNGKGRKYRGGWQGQEKGPQDVDRLLAGAFSRAIEDLERYAERAEHEYEVVRGNCIERVSTVEQVDAAIFSPPYPNSFDYTDIYNIELWVLGYLASQEDNAQLRRSTLRSHVQCTFDAPNVTAESPTLARTVVRLGRVRARLWDPRIPEMIAGYFSDLALLLRHLRSTVRVGGSTFVVVGDSSYRDVPIRVAEILAEIAETEGYETRAVTTIRQMRTSAQQGGGQDLNESVLHLRNRIRRASARPQASA